MKSLVEDDANDEDDDCDGDGWKNDGGDDVEVVKEEDGKNELCKRYKNN